MEWAAHQVCALEDLPDGIGRRVLRELLTVRHFFFDNGEFVVDIVIFHFSIKARERFLGLVNLASGDIPPRRFGDDEEADGRQSGMYMSVLDRVENLNRWREGARRTRQKRIVSIGPFDIRSGCGWRWSGQRWPRRTGQGRTKERLCQMKLDFSDGRTSGDLRGADRRRAWHLGHWSV